MVPGSIYAANDCTKPTLLRASAKPTVFFPVVIVKQGERRQYEPPFKKAPRVSSCRFASRANGSFRHFMNQLKLCNRCRALATHARSWSRHCTQALETGSG